MFLVTTSNQKTWKKDEKILFLGGWCKQFKQKQDWETLDFEVLPYHWDNREQFHQDCYLVDEIYEKYLNALTKALNKTHQVDYSVRYWRIVLGPWLWFFIHILYDKYLSVCAVIDLGKVSNTWILKHSDFRFVAKDFGDYIHFLSLDDDMYFYYLYSEIIRHLDGIPYQEIELVSSTVFKGPTKPSRLIKTRIFANLLYKTLIKVIPFHSNKVVFGERVDFWQQILLQLKLKSAPNFLFSGGCSG